MAHSSPPGKGKPMLLMQMVNPSFKQKETGFPLEKSLSRSPQLDIPSKPLISVEPAFRLT